MQIIHRVTIGHIVMLMTLSGCGSGNNDSAATPPAASTQDIHWQLQSSPALPQGLQFYQGSKDNNVGFAAWYLQLDSHNSDLSLTPVKSQPFLTLAQLPAENLLAAVNGGYFGGDQSYSAAIAGEQLLSKNIASLNRSGKSYPVMRALFTLDTAGNSEVSWAYHFGDSISDIRTYSAPLSYLNNDAIPQPAPAISAGKPLPALKMAIGGGPVLLRQGSKVLSYNEEIFWGSGVELNDVRPRTAIGYTASGHILLFVTNAMKLSELPDQLLALGVEGAINLDGGGSSAMRLLDSSIYSQQRAIPVALTIQQH
ncbi:phosphodiester glycosidase family protein [Rheinheimera maricola]|uniref:Phosphodiester glycosidase family protein n=1 Tax=Rheinheimera maricola TaxID=2793282 RepID=A0ABS7X7Q9_9GAMM|nr:phosphodiester glycosidase family protein [Rheinheimera maricola]MBZ9611590.1 phosphodiester glycosidase family protein [Rheinheimera maricola]